MAWFAVMGVEQVAYHEATVLGREDDHPGQALDYYGSRGETPLRWGGAGAERLCLDGQVTPEAYRLAFGPGGFRDPLTGQQLVSTKRPGFELVVSAHKSLSLLGVVAHGPAGFLRPAPRSVDVSPPIRRGACRADAGQAALHPIASVLGAYERGEQAISVPRLQRLARLYRVPVAELISHGERTTPSPTDRPMTIDLVALRQLEGSHAVLLSRYLRAIEVERGDYNGRVLTIRRSDAIAMASILQCLPHHVPARLDHLGLRLTP